MLRALTCPSSGGQIVLSQYQVSSPSVKGCTVCRTRADSAEQSALIRQTVYSAESALIRHTAQPFTEGDDTRWCDNTICLSEDGHVNSRNMSRIIM